jgi:hypothetical protein
MAIKMVELPVQSFQLVSANYKFDFYLALSQNNSIKMAS